MISNGFEIPFIFDRNLILMEGAKPSEKDLQTLPIIAVTSGTEWNPESVSLPLQDSTRWMPLPSDDPGITSRKPFLRNVI